MNILLHFQTKTWPPIQYGLDIVDLLVKYNKYKAHISSFLLPPVKMIFGDGLVYPHLTARTSVPVRPGDEHEELSRDGSQIWIKDQRGKDHPQNVQGFVTVNVMQTIVRDEHMEKAYPYSI